MKRLAVLISIYNDQDGFERSIRSLNLPPDSEIVVVDDGSTPPLQAIQQSGTQAIQQSRNPAFKQSSTTPIAAATRRPSKAWMR